MSDTPPRHHRRRDDRGGGDPAETERLRRLIQNPGPGAHPHRRARGDNPYGRDHLPHIDGDPRDRDPRVRPAADGWREPDRARPRQVPPAPPRYRSEPESSPSGRSRTPTHDESTWGTPTQNDPTRNVSIENSSTRTGPIHTDSAPSDSAQFEAARTESARTESARTESARDPRTRRDRVEAPQHFRPDDPRAETPRPAGARRRAPAQTQARRRRRRVVIALVMVIMAAVVCGIGYAGLRMTGYFVDDDDYSNASGTGDVLVQIPQDATLTRFGEILHDQGVVASVRAFTDAAGSGAISAGFYKLRTGIPASTAVSMLQGDSNRVGRVVIPPGRQLDTKQTSDGAPSTGIFAMIAQATAVTIDGKRTGVTQEQLAQAAATASPADLGVPSWATSDVERLDGDHRRIEGLIAPVAFEAIDPSLSPAAMLKYLISTSAGLFEQWGLLATNQTGLSPYQNLVSASVVEKEVANPDDYGKVARVILNRLGKNQKLEMDSTANYTAAVVNIDVSGDAYTADTKWNTYQVNGLPATPIGSVGREPLEATDNPPAGNWIYFVAVDSEGTTLFTENYDEHLRNRQKACDNKVLAVGCR